MSEILDYTWIGYTFRESLQSSIQKDIITNRDYFILGLICFTALLFIIPIIQCIKNYSNAASYDYPEEEKEKNNDPSLKPLSIFWGAMLSIVCFFCVVCNGIYKENTRRLEYAEELKDKGMYIEAQLIYEDIYNRCGDVSNVYNLMIENDDYIKAMMEEN